MNFLELLRPILPPRSGISVTTGTFVGTLVLGLVGGIDVLTGGELNSAIFAAALITGALNGAALGLALTLVMGWLSRAPTLVALGLWVAVGFADAGFLMSALGAFRALGGEHHSLGLFALAASLCLGGYVAALGLVFQPTRAKPEGWGRSLRASRRVLLLGVLATALIALFVSDEYLFPLTYRVAHLAMRRASLLTLFGIALLGLTWLPLLVGAQRRLRWATLGVLTLAGGAALTLDEDDRSTLDAMLVRPLVGLSLRSLRVLTDVDADGYSSLLGGGDCAAFNASINPGAEEIPQNGLDDNCLGGDAQVNAGYDLSDLVFPEEPSPVSVVLITIDTLRADRMSLYGYQRNTTPHIDRWAKEAMTFKRGYTSGPWTSLAMSSLFRGVYPRRLKWTFLWETSSLRLLRAPLQGKLRKKEKARKVFATPIEDAHRPLPQWMSLRGMRTEAMVDDGKSQFLAQSQGVSGQWDSFRQARLYGKLKGDKHVTRESKRRLSRLAKSDQPFLLWAHYFGPHDSPRKEHGKRRYGKSRSDLYDHKLHYTDEQVGALLEAIEETEHKHPIAVILTADHGEEFLKDHRGHGANLRDENLRVPLLVKGPGFEAGTNETVVSLVDVLPTILEWTGSPEPPGLDGYALQKVVTGSIPEDRVVLAETWAFNRSQKVSIDRIAAIDADYKLEWNLKDQNKSLRRIEDSGFEAKTNLIEEENRPRLQEAADLYLDQNRSVDAQP